MFGSSSATAFLRWSRLGDWQRRGIAVRATFESLTQDPAAFRALVARAQARDQEAAADLVRACERDLHRYLQASLARTAFRAGIDAHDLAQSTYARFFAHLHRRELTPRSTAQLKHLLLAMARNLLRDYARQQLSQRRDIRRQESVPDFALLAIADRQRTPCQAAELDELKQRFRNLLSPEERELVDERIAGRSWRELAARFQSTPDALRKRTARAIARAAAALRILDDNA